MSSVDIIPRINLSSMSFLVSSTWKNYYFEGLAFFRRLLEENVSVKFLESVVNPSNLS
jgi:hypothetical protein